jgi:hypothetical protein
MFFDIPSCQTKLAEVKSMKIENIGKIAIVALLSVALLCVPAAAYDTVWNGTVDLDYNEYFMFEASNSEVLYNYSEMTDVGAFYAASEIAPGFTYFVNDSWYPSFGSFYVEEIDGTANYVNNSAWFMYINDNYCNYGLGNATNTMNEGDTLKWYYAPFTYDQYWNVQVDLPNATDYIGIYVI